MTRAQAAQRLLKMVNLRDAKEACEMGAKVLLDLPWLIGMGVVVGFLIGVLLMAVTNGR